MLALALLVAQVAPAGAAQAPSPAPAPCAPASVRLAAAHVVAGAATRATLRLTCRARGPVRVALDAPDGVSVPKRVVVREGRREASFPVTTTAATTGSAGRVTATAGGRSAHARLVVEPAAAGCADAALAGLSAPAHTFFGERLTGTVSLTCAPSAPVVVALAAGERLRVPPQVSVPAGATTAAFPVDATGYGARAASSVTASLGGTSRTVAVTADPGLVTFAVSGARDYDARVLDLQLSELRPDAAPVLVLGSDHPEIIAPRTMPLPDGGEVTHIDVEAKVPATLTTVTLTLSLGTSTLTATTLAGPPPTTMSGAVRMHGDYGTSVDAGFGPVSGTTVVTITATVVEFPEVTGSLTTTVYPTVASIDAPAAAVSGQTFPLTVHMQGTSPFDRRLQVSSPHSVCSPEPVVLAAGTTTVSVSCTVQPVTRSEPEWLNVSEQHLLLARSITISPAPTSRSRPAG